MGHFKMYKVVTFVLSFAVIAIYGFKLEANEASTRKEGCIVPSWRGDNYCDDGNNNEGPQKCVKVENGIKTETTTKLTPDGSGTCSISSITETTNLNTGTGLGKGWTGAGYSCDYKAKCD